MEKDLNQTFHNQQSKLDVGVREGAAPTNSGC